MQREKRLGIECTHDEPERTLCKVCPPRLFVIECTHDEPERTLCKVCLRLFVSQ